VAQLQDGKVNRFNLKSPLCPALHWFFRLYNPILNVWPKIPRNKPL
jgi:hypothetical protein